MIGNCLPEILYKALWIKRHIKALFYLLCIIALFKILSKIISNNLEVSSSFKKALLTRHSRCYGTLDSHRSSVLGLLSSKESRNWFTLYIVTDVLKLEKKGILVFAFV